MAKSKTYIEGKFVTNANGAGTSVDLYLDEDFNTKWDGHTVENGIVFNGTEIDGKFSVYTTDDKILDGESKTVYLRRQDVQEYTDVDDATSLINRAISDVNNVFSGFKESFDLSSQDWMLNDMNNVFGAPYQFLPWVDRRIEISSGKTSCIGRKYGQKITSRMSLLLMIPGKQVFMPAFSDSDKNAALSKLASGIAEGIKDSLDSMLTKRGMYYDFEYDYNGFFDYLNPMANSLAVLMGLGERTVNIGRGVTQKQTVRMKIGGKNRTLATMDWKEYMNSTFQTLFQCSQAIPFYIDSPNSVSDSFQNSTRESAFASKINGLSDTAKELQFVNQNVMNTTVKTLDAESSDDGLVQKLVEAFTKEGSAGRFVGDSIGDLLTGAKIIYPEMWDDSSFERSYSFTIKLRSPDADRLSVYMNILVPLLFLICMALPKKMSQNTYNSPNLVRCYYKGMFNINMGIITSLQISKGDEACWTDDGIPTKVDVNVDIKDLYSNIAMVKGKNILDKTTAKIDFVTNTGMIDYLCNLCGVNLQGGTISRMGALYWNLTQNEFNVSKITNRVSSSIEQAITSKINKVFNI